MTTWKDVWNVRNISEVTESVLEELIRLDGFDSGAGFISAKNWLEYVSTIMSKVDMNDKKTVFEVGCGSGAFLYPLFQLGYYVGGLDFSNALIARAEKVMPGMDFEVNEALKVGTVRKYDLVLSNSAFQYFPDLTYAEDVMRKMFEKSNQYVMILDVPDYRSQKQSEEFRRGSLSSGEYEQKYRDLKHLYYDKEWFDGIARGYEYKIEIFNQIIASYGNNAYRYNVIIEKTN